MALDPTAGAEIVSEAHELIVGARQDAYSHPLDDYGRTARIFNSITGHDITTEEAVLFMVAVKLSRIAHEISADLDLPDNTRDAIGYLGCLNMVRQRKKDHVARIVEQMNKPFRFKTGETNGPA